MVGWLEERAHFFFLALVSVRVSCFRGGWNFFGMSGDLAAFSAVSVAALIL